MNQKVKSGTVLACCIVLCLVAIPAASVQQTNSVTWWEYETTETGVHFKNELVGTEIVNGIECLNISISGIPGLDTFYLLLDPNKYGKWKDVIPNFNNTGDTMIRYWSPKPAYMLWDPVNNTAYSQGYDTTMTVEFQGETSTEEQHYEYIIVEQDVEVTVPAGTFICDHGNCTVTVAGNIVSYYEFYFNYDVIKNTVKDCSYQPATGINQHSILVDYKYASN